MPVDRTRRTTTERSLRGHRGLAPSLRGRADLLAEYTAMLVDRLEINFLWKSNPTSSLVTWLAISTTGARLRCDSNRPLMKCRLPGPHEPAQAVRLPVSSASAP